MLNPFKRLKNNKPLLFGLYGASGCLTAAILLGEPFLALTKAKPLELIADDLRLACRMLGKIIGVVDVEEILDVIFSRFCIGK